MFCFSFFFWFDLFRNSQFVFNKDFNKIVMYFTNMKTKRRKSSAILSKQLPLSSSLLSSPGKILIKFCKKTKNQKHKSRQCVHGETGLSDPSKDSTGGIFFRSYSASNCCCTLCASFGRGEKRGWEVAVGGGGRAEAVVMGRDGKKVA